MQLLIIVLLALVNGFLAMSELAVISSRRARLEYETEQGRPGADTALKLLDDPNRFLSTVQIGITLIGIVAGVFGGAAVADDLAEFIARIDALEPYSDALGFAGVVAFTTYLSLVLGELVPKRLAIQQPERIACLVAPVMRRLSQFTAPLVAVLSLSTEAVSRLLGVRVEDDGSATEEEIKLLLREGMRSGAIDRDEQEMVAGVFRLDDLRVEALMTPRTETAWLDADDTPEAIRQVLLDNDYSRFPVMDGSADNVIGIVKTRDLLNACLQDQPMDLRELARDVPFIPETTPADEALRVLRRNRADFAFVIGEYGGIEGIVTASDIAAAVVGDVEAPEVVQRDDDSWLVDGLMPVEAFKDLFGIRENLPGEADNDFQTLAGFAMKMHGRIPAAADHFTWKDLYFEVVDMDGRRVDKLLIRRLDDENAPENTPDESAS